MLAFLIQSNDSIFQISEEWVFQHTFHQRDEVVSLQKTYSLKTIPQREAKLVFMLIELDNSDSKDFVLKALRQALKEAKSVEGLDKTILNKAIGHDDYLGHQQYDFSTYFGPFNKTLTFKGLQLFDKYEYELSMGSSY